jgi:class 3 adenylate cyclase
MTNHLPSGTVTFLFTDIEGSTKLWQEQPEAMAISHVRHDEILREAIESNHGYVFQIVGDSFSAAFHNAIDGLRTVLSAQRGLQVETWGETGAIKVRMGLHTGTAEALPDGK